MKYCKHHIGCILTFAIVLSGYPIRNVNAVVPQQQVTNKEAFIKDLKKRTFCYFWDLADTNTWQVPDRYPSKTFTSIAATGFGLSAYIVGVENNYISREEAAQRTLNTLAWLLNSAQGDGEKSYSGYQGFYYHFLTYGKGERYKEVELSTIDTGLLMAGVLTSMSYFDKDNETEKQIREIAVILYERVNWKWAMNGKRLMSMGWNPEEGFLKSEWEGYNEAMILLIMALGSPTYPIPANSWDAWCNTYDWDEFYGYEHLNFEPLFGHQYSHMFIDFRDIKDEYMREKGIDYFENSRRATLSNRAYCIDNPKKYLGYSDSIWGLTACDGAAHALSKKDLRQKRDGKKFIIYDYKARGASANLIVDDGTIAPTAAGGSVPFASDECLNALFSMYTVYGDSLYQDYGFKDAFNASVLNSKTGKYGWIAEDYLGINQGPILIQIENFQTGLMWNILKKNPYIVDGLRKAGFKGGWLEEQKCDRDEN